MWSAPCWPGIARPQDAGQRLPALVQVAAGPFFSECAVTGVASKSKMIRSGLLPSPRPARAPADARLAARRSGRLSGVGVVVDQAGEERDQVGALLGGEGGEKLILHLGK